MSRLFQLSAIFALYIFCASHAWAGPPFVTDDPEPVEFHHWEVYAASRYSHTPEGSTGTAPHVEINYGASPNMQLHLILPYAFNHPSGEGDIHGLGDTEIGVKYRFLQEDGNRPMAGIFPLVEIPTGSEEKGLGSGHFQLFLPVWFQKSFGSWTTYGGGGYFINPGSENKNYWLAGWEIQKDLNKRLTLGGEIFGNTKTSATGRSEIDFNVGGIYNFDEGHHLMFSSGRAISGSVDFMSYIAFQWTFGPNTPAHNTDQTIR